MSIAQHNTVEHACIIWCYFSNRNIYISVRFMLHIWTMEVTYMYDCYTSGRKRLHIGTTTVTYLEVTYPLQNQTPLWHHQIKTVSVLLALCERNPRVTGGFPSQSASNAGFGVFFDVSLYKRLNKQTSRWWCETPRCSLQRHCNDIIFQSLAAWTLCLNIEMLWKLR